MVERVWIVMLSRGSFDEAEVWVAGVFTDEAAAKRTLAVQQAEHARQWEAHDAWFKQDPTHTMKPTPEEKAALDAFTARWRIPVSDEVAAIATDYHRRFQDAKAAWRKAEPPYDWTRNVWLVERAVGQWRDEP